jgi:hypothetical protein
MVEVDTPSFDPRLARVVKVKVADESGEDTIGSGHFVAPGLVLTARHVLWRDGTPAEGDYAVAALRVRAATGPSAGRSLPVSNLVLLGEVSGVDVAVLVVPGLEPVAGTVVVGARFTADQPVPGCWMAGYPKAAHQDGTVGAEYVGVSVLPVSGTVAGRIAVQVTTPPVRKDADWRGLSGSGVVDAQSRLLGILAAVQVRWDERLAVVPVQAIVEAAGGQLGEHPVLQRVADLEVADGQGDDIEERVKVSVFDRTKFPPRLTDLRGESLFEVLQFKNRVVDFIGDGGRGELVEDALVWVREVRDRPDFKVAVVTGPAGVGKSRLAAEICDRLAASDPWWRAGFADHSMLLSAPVPVVPTVVVCDYPERHPEAVGRYLTRIHEQRRASRLQGPVRVLLVARDERSWFDRAQAACTNLDALIDHRIALSLQQFGPEPQVLHAREAFTAFCKGFGIPEEQRPEFALEQDGLNRPLLVHIAALLAAWQHTQFGRNGVAPEPAPGVDKQGRLLDDVISAEVRRLLRLRRDDGTEQGATVFTSRREVREALCVTTLTAPAHGHLPALLACTDAFGPNGNTNRIPAADALLDIFPAGDADSTPDHTDYLVAPVEPDLIAARLLDQTPGRSALVKRLITSDTVAEEPTYRAQLIGALALAAKDYPGIGTDLREHLADSLSTLIDAGTGGQAPLSYLLAEHLAGLVEAAVAAAADQDLTAARTLATAILLPVSADEHRIDAAAASALWRLPYPHPGLTGLGVALATRALTHHERDGAPANIAAASGALGNWLGAHGQRPEALAATQRAMDLYEELAADDRAAYLPNLAASVNNLGNRVAEAGRVEEGLAAAQRAMDLWEELVADDRAAHLPDFAGSVHNLAIRMGESGRRAEGLAAAQRAVALREELVADDRAAHLPDLATSVHNLAIDLAEAGRRTEALETAQRAVDLREELVADDRAAHLPDLAGSLNNLAIRMGESGRRAEGLAAAQRVVDLREELVADDRAAHLPDLAGSVNNLAADLAEAGRRTEALETAQRAIDLYEELVGGDRAAYLPDLARSYWAAAHVRKVLGTEIAAGLEYCDRAMRLYLKLAEAEPEAFEEMLDAVRALRARLAEMLDQED